MGKNRNKAATLMHHFKVRMSQRYGICVTQFHMDQIRHQINNHICPKVRKESNTKSVFLIILEEQEIPVIWDHSRRVPVTCLEREWVDEDISRELI